MIVLQNPETGYWTELGNGLRLVTHAPEACEGRLCDVHNRRGPEPWCNWPLNWREDRGMMEVYDLASGIGHPTRAQYDYWSSIDADLVESAMVHGCDGGCDGLYD